jgi:mitogen-activated protein kinase 1/3/mitogen-activated protein kinase 6
MKYLHSGGILHRDLKPRNLLVNSNCDLKIADFGLSRVEFTRQHLNTGPMTEYICTRWYRAPEILCSASSYGPAMDVWSIGCIFAELLSRQPLLPGKNTKHQLELTLKLLGLPSKREVQGIENPKCRQFIQSFENIVPQGGVIERLKDRLPAETPNSALELVARMLTFSADHRLSVNQAIQHAYVQDLYCPEDEPVLPGELPSSPFEFERRRTGAEGLRAEVYDEMLQMCTPEQRERYYRKHPRPDITRYPALREGESVYDD